MRSVWQADGCGAPDGKVLANVDKIHGHTRGLESERPPRTSERAAAMHWGAKRWRTLKAPTKSIMLAFKQDGSASSVTVPQAVSPAVLSSSPSAMPMGESARATEGGFVKGEDVSEAREVERSSKERKHSVIERVALALRFDSQVMEA